MESLAPYPAAEPDFAKSSTVRNWEAQLLAAPPGSDPAFLDLRRILTGVVSTPEYSLADDYGWIKGQQFAIQTLFGEAMKINLETLGTDFHEPIFFFEGRYDPYCRPQLVLDYSQEMKAPQKEVVWFENSGHFPFYEEREKFREELVDQVLPLAK